MATPREALRRGLKAAGDSFARTMRTVAATRTQHTAEAVNTQGNGDTSVLIRGGRPGGAYGWEPIQALMFDNNMRHPLFGNKRKWYHQGRFPITELTETTGIEIATEAFTDEFVPAFLDGYGFH